MNNNGIIQSALGETKELTLNLEGWINPLIIEYVYMVPISGESELHWKVKGTVYTFKISLTIIYKKHNSNISEHFTLTLQQFRKDYLDWWKQKWPEEWMKNYWEFSNFIKV